ncbi:hypothetical protein [Streptomyces sp. NPDC001404]|uniref:hypothetical protein n=1 Tax=Streptomyces sp. NPDC001404 TaxID=3364571 RepID=UPI0036B3D7B1
MTDSIKTDDDIARRLLDEALSDEITPARHIPAPGRVTPGIAPFVVPEGYTVRETHRTLPDGSIELEREVVPPAPDLAARVAPAVPARAPHEVVEPMQLLPGWLTGNRRRIKAVAFLTGAAGTATVAGIYGSEIAAGITTAAAAVWSATVTVLKIVGIGLGVGLALRLAFGGGSKRSRTGTFEGSFKGTWRKD